MKFENAVEYILKHEGGYVFHQKDPGGETNFGISKRAYPNLNIKDLTRDDAKEIYRRDYWNKISADLLPHFLRLSVFDSAVNQGPQRAIGLLQAALGVSVDGVLGPATLEAAGRANPEKLLKAYARIRMNRYADDRNFAIFGEGWTQRLLDIFITSALYINEGDEV